MSRAAQIKTLCSEVALFADGLRHHAACASLNDNTTEMLMARLGAVFRTRVALEHRLTLLRELAPNCAEAGSEAGHLLREIAA